MGAMLGSPEEMGAYILSETISGGATEIADMFDASSGRELFMTIPYRYMIRRILQLSIVSFAISLLSWELITIVLIPWYAIHCFKIHTFITWCKVINVSARKLWTFFIAVWILFEVSCIFLRDGMADLLANIGPIGIFHLQNLMP